MSEKNKNVTPNYVAIIIAPVRYCKELEAGAKLLYADLTALSCIEGYCWASNAYLAELNNVCESTIEKWLHSLKDKQFIFIETTKKGMGWDRKIRVFQNNFANPQNLRFAQNTPETASSTKIDSTDSSERAVKIYGYEPEKFTTYNNISIDDDDDREKKFIDNGVEKSLNVSDVHSYAVKFKPDWSYQEIQDAWHKFLKYKETVNQPFEYIESIINHQRIIKQNKEKKCKKTTAITPTKKEPSKSANVFYTEKDTSESPLARYARQNGLK